MRSLSMRNLDFLRIIFQRTTKQLAKWMGQLYKSVKSGKKHLGKRLEVNKLRYIWNVTHTLQFDFAQSLLQTLRQNFVSVFPSNRCQPITRIVRWHWSCNCLVLCDGIESYWIKLVHDFIDFISFKSLRNIFWRFFKCLNSCSWHF